MIDKYYLSVSCAINAFKYFDYKETIDSNFEASKCHNYRLYIKLIFSKATTLYQFSACVDMFNFKYNKRLHNLYATFVRTEKSHVCIWGFRQLEVWHVGLHDQKAFVVPARVSDLIESFYSDHEMRVFLTCHSSRARNLDVLYS